jgi:hypothetical protein
MDDAGDEINISFSNTVNFTAKDIYLLMVENIRRYIGSSLFERIYENLLEGISTDLDRCQLLPQGLKFRSKSFFGKPKEHLVPWQFLTYVYDENYRAIGFKSTKDESASIRLDAKTDLNAVVLMYFSDWLRRHHEKIKAIYAKNKIQ